MLKPSKRSTATVVPMDADGVALCARRPRRQGLYVHNTTGEKLYVLLGDGSAGGVTASTFTFYLEIGAVYEMPAGLWTGPVWGFTVSGTGSARVAELY